MAEDKVARPPTTSPEQREPASGGGEASVSGAEASGGEAEERPAMSRRTAQARRLKRTSVLGTTKFKELGLGLGSDTMLESWDDDFAIHNYVSYSLLKEYI